MIADRAERLVQTTEELTRRIDADDPGLEIVHRHLAGIDVGNESHFVAVAPGRDPQPVRLEGRFVTDGGMAEIVRHRDGRDAVDRLGLDRRL